MDKNLWDKFAHCVKTKLLGCYVPTAPLVEDLKSELNFNHCGFYIGIVDSKNQEMLREGFLEEGLTNLQDSSDAVIQKAYEHLRTNNIPKERVQTGVLNITVITSCTYIPDPTDWDENSDGIYLQWGQDYRGLYLPYQIKRMNIPKIDIMDRLCCWECKLASNLWRDPCGLCFRLTSHSHSI